MTYPEFLNKIINDGIEAARTDYTEPHQEQHLEGSIEGFELCRNKTPEQLSELLNKAQNKAHDALINDVDDYWFWRCRELEIEWVCNCVSALLISQGGVPIVAPTTRAFLKAAELFGVEAISSNETPVEE